MRDIISDEEIVKKLKIKPGDKILDLGGSMKQRSGIAIDTLADIIRPEDAPYGPSQLKAKNFVKIDITKSRLPFKDKEFDICLCTHVLEDLNDPFFTIDEIVRVAKKGLIVTPSMGEDMKFTSIDFTDWLTGARRAPGQAHHKWFFIDNGGSLEIIPKIYPVLYTKDFQIVNWFGEKEMIFPWQGKIKYHEFSGLNIHKLIDRYERFVKYNAKNIKMGRVAVFIDNPLNLIKALIKRLLKKGEGYKHRKFF